MIGRPRIDRTTAAYTSNCCSSLGGLVGVQEQEFGAEQPDADGPAVEASLDFAAELDIAPELDPAAVQRLGGQVGLACEDLKPGRSLGGQSCDIVPGFPGRGRG